MVVVGDEDVGRLDVPVDESSGVGGVERRADLADDAKGATERKSSFLGEQGLQVGALDARHRDIEQAVRLAGVVDRDDARMVERGGELRLP